MHALWLTLGFPLWAPWRLWRWLRFRGAKPHTLVLHLSGAMRDVAARTGRPFSPSPGPNLWHTLQRLEAARADPRVRTLLVEWGAVKLGLAQAEELAAAFERFREDEKKRVVLYSETLDLPGYWAALGCSRVVLAPGGQLGAAGIGLSIPLLRRLLSRFGLRAQLLGRGPYKSARETFSAEVESAENVEMMGSLTQDLGAQLHSRLAKRLGTSPLEASHTLDQAPCSARKAAAAGLVDSLAYPDELLQELGVEPSRSLSLSSYARLARYRNWLPSRPRSVALLVVEGSIRSGRSNAPLAGRNATGSDSFCTAVDQVRRDKRIEAAVLRVDSPGGSALASDLMWRSLSQLAAQKPTFVSMGNMAASGGYYVSALEGARIWAGAASLTGSIGVVAGKVEASALLARLGVRARRLASNEGAHHDSPTLPWGDAELTKLRAEVDDVYQDFVRKMAQSRGMEVRTLESAAEGRVWTGQQALKAGLVDHLGGVWDVQEAVCSELGARRPQALRWVTPSGGDPAWRAWLGGRGNGGPLHLRAGARGRPSASSAPASAPAHWLAALSEAAATCFPGAPVLLQELGAESEMLALLEKGLVCWCPVRTTAKA